jgi:hypothetical protein
MLRDSSRYGIYFKVDEILRSPMEAALALKYYEACCDATKRHLEQCDLSTILYYGKIRYTPINETKKYFKMLRALQRKEKAIETESCC